MEEPSPPRTPQVRRFLVQRFQDPAQYSPGELKRGGRRDNQEGFQRSQWEDVWRDRRLHTREAQAFAGTRALHKSCAALLDTGSPASSIRKKVWNDMPGSGAVSSDGEAPTQSRTASASVQLNVLLGRKGTIRFESSDHPDGTAGTIFLYGSKKRNKDETAVTLTAQDEGPVAGDHRFKNGLIRLSE